MSPAKKRILLLRYGAMGDILFATPAIRALRQSHPDAHIAFACLRQWKWVLRRNPHIDRIHPLPGTQIEDAESLARAPWDLLVNLQDFDNAAQVAESLPAAERRGNRWIDGHSHSLQPQGLQYHSGNDSYRLAHTQGLSTAALLCRIAGVPDDDLQLKFHPAPLRQFLARRLARRLRRQAAGRKLVALHLHSRGSPARCWLPQDARPVLQALGNEVHFVILGYHPDRDAIAGLEDLPNASYDFSPIQTQAALLPLCDAFLGINSGPRNLASALGVPLVGLFGLVDVRIVPCLPGEIALQSPKFNPKLREEDITEPGCFLQALKTDQIVASLRHCLSR